MSQARVFPEASLYDQDYNVWTQQQARLLRERRFAEIDLAHLADEVESVGRSQKREIRNRLSVLVAHLLKWKCQPGLRASSWRATIRNQRNELQEVLTDSPSLRDYPAQVFDGMYPSARLLASKETGIDFTLFAEVAPFTIEQALDDDFLPKEPDLEDRT